MEELVLLLLLAALLDNNVSVEQFKVIAEGAMLMLTNIEEGDETDE